MAFTEKMNCGISDDTTPVTMVSAPITGRNIVSGFTVVNKDTAPVTVLIQLRDGINTFNILTVELDEGDQVLWGREDSPIILDTTDRSLELVLNGTVDNNQLPFTVFYAEVT